MTRQVDLRGFEDLLKLLTGERIDLIPLRLLLTVVLPQPERGVGRDDFILFSPTLRSNNTHTCLQQNNPQQMYNKFSQKKMRLDSGYRLLLRINLTDSYRPIQFIERQSTAKGGEA